jgi:hypothetical protein
MVVFLLLLLVSIAVFPGRDTSAYEAYCKAECWSMRKPCCRAV